jgi:1-acyl-sn-glycerol-3-phosphate acyltransferase
VEAHDCLARRSPMNQDTGLANAAAAPRGGLVTRLWGVVATLLSVLYTAVLLIFAAAAAPFRRGHWVTPIMRLWCWLIFHTCGITAEVEGLEHLAGLDSCILVSNHQSLIDILAVIYVIPREIRFLAKREIMRVPLFGSTMAHSGNIVIDRYSGGRTIRHALDRIDDGYSICVFAEGHRFSDNQVHEFNDGAAWLAIATRQPCVPLAISGTGAMMPRGTKFVVPGRRLRLVLGRPIATTGLRGKDRTELTRELEAAVRELYQRGA